LIHGDIKGVSALNLLYPLAKLTNTQANILIDGDGNARITDFGLLTITETQALGNSFTTHDLRGSVRWMAPELFVNPEAKKNRSTDVYAFAMTVLEVGCL
jgi:serine/threonine protein kinase